MPFAILRFQKCKAGSVTARYSHNERKKAMYKSNPDIDTSRKQDNYHLVLPKQPYRQEVRRMIQAAGCKTRKDSTVMVETLITASPEFMHDLSPPEQREFFTLATSFIAQRIGQDNIISAVVHMDETTPHMHLCFVPITDGKTPGTKSLSAKAILGNQASLSKWQTDYHAAMSARWPELERGVSAQITKRKHIPVWMFKTAERLDKQYSDVEAALNNIGHYTLQEQREKALDVLARWLPQAERFTAQLKTIDGNLAAMLDVQAKAQEQVREAQATAEWRVAGAEAQAQRKIDERQGEFNLMWNHIHELKRQIRTQESIISRIPFKLREEIREKVAKLNGQKGPKDRTERG